MYRPCLVRDRLAIFHRWYETDVITLHFKTLLSQESKDRATKEYNETNILPNCMERDKTRRIMALVEYEDGTVDEVFSTDIQFLDSDRYFKKEGH